MRLSAFVITAAIAFALAGCKGEPPQATPPEKTPAPKSAGTVVVIETNLGSIEIALDEKRAPRTVRNFLNYVQRNFYDGTIFHRVKPGFVIQGGGYTPDLRRKPTGPPVVNESNNGLSNKRGTVAMARTSDPDSATSQFYINLRDNVSLDGRPGRPGYTVFGKVVSGMDVVDRIAAVRTHTAKTAGGMAMRDVPVEPVVIKSVRVKQ